MDCGFVTLSTYMYTRLTLFGSYKGHPTCLGILGQDPSVVSKSYRLHVMIFRFFFNTLRYIPYIILKMVGKFFEVLNFNQLSLKLN